MLDNEQITKLLNTLSAVVKEGNFGDIERLVLSEEYRPLRSTAMDVASFVSIAQEAILLKQTETVRLFLDLGLRPMEFISKPNLKGEHATLLSLSASVDHLPVTQLLTERALARNREDALKHMQFALSVAIKAGLVDTVAYFLEQGGQLNPKDLADKLFDMELPLNESNQRLVGLLLESKPNINVCFHYLYERLSFILEDLPPEFDDSYYFAITTLLNPSHPTNFTGMAVSALWYFLHNFDVSNVNLTNISVQGQPLTREQLLEKKVRGADKAIFSSSELDNLPNANTGSSGLIHYRQQLHDALAEQEQSSVASCSFR